MSNYLAQYEELSPDDEKLTYVMLSTVKAYPMLHAIFMNTADNRYFFQAVDFRTLHHRHYLSKPTQKLPSETDYALRIVDRTKTPPEETWQYKDFQFKTLDTETFPSSFEPKDLHWRKGATSTGQLFWSNVYVYDPTGDKGIAVSIQVNSKEGKFLGVVGADLPLAILEHYISRQKVGKSLSLRVLKIR